MIYINDLSKISALFDFINYADDTTLSSILTSFGMRQCELSANINLELDKINNWLKINKLSLNISKTKFMIFHTPQKHIIKPNLYIDDIEIDQVVDFNFLGINFNENMNWKSHIDKIASKISRAIGILNRLKRQLPVEIKITLYNTLILPHINYGILLWGDHCERIVKLQKKAMRRITVS